MTFHREKLRLYILGAILLEACSQGFSFRSSKTCAFCAPRSIRGSSRRAYRRSRISPVLHTSKKPNEEGYRDEENDNFPNWIKVLSQWPRTPSSSEKAQEQDDSWLSDYSLLGDLGLVVDKNSSKDEIPGLLEPLTDILNAEALLSISQVDEATKELEREQVNMTVDSLLSMDARNTETSSLNLTRLEELSGWDRWIGQLSRSVSNLAPKDQLAFAKSAEGVLRQATSRIESLVSDASSVVSTSTIQALIVRATEAVQNTTSANDLFQVAVRIAMDRGLNVRQAAEQARATSAYATSLAQVAGGIIRKGYVAGDAIPQKQTLLDGVPAVEGSKALFADFQSASEITEYGPVIAKAAEMGALSGAVYEETIPRLRDIGHTVVDSGYTKDVFWMVTDSVANETSFKGTLNAKESFLVRTITIRGFDASDDNVDREDVLNQICIASPVKAGNGVLVHSGLMKIARAIYKDVKKYIDWTAPQHRIVLNGHSVGGSLSILMLLLIARDRGADFVHEKIPRVYTFGSPPVVCLEKPPDEQTNQIPITCRILEAFDLPCDLVHGYVQPWDPIVRLFSEYDAFYPLVGDLGTDGVTPFAGGPPRTLRPITKAILEAWDGWPRFRENFRDTASQNFTCVGIQHLLLPDPTRYLADRFVAVSILVPPVETVLRIHSGELYPALKSSFPVDVFEISFIPQAIRSFVHHFYPAYGGPLVEYVRALERRASGSIGGQPVEERDQRAWEMPTAVANGKRAEAAIDWSRATQWLQGKEKQ